MHKPDKAAPTPPAIIERLPTTSALAAHLGQLAYEAAQLHDRAALADGILRSATTHALIVLDSLGRITEWGRGAESLFGHAAPDMLGRSADLLLTQDDRSAGRLTQDLSAALQTGRADAGAWRVHRDGTRIVAYGAITPLLDAAGEPVGFLAILQPGG